MARFLGGKGGEEGMLDFSSGGCNAAISEGDFFSRKGPDGKGKDISQL